MTSRRSAIITGAASGLGRACAERFAADGVAIMAVDVDEVGLNDLVASLGAEAHGVVIDVRDASDCRGVVAECVRRFGRLDILVNAAGVYGRRPILEISAEDWQHVFGINVVGTYNMAIAAVAEMKVNAAGHIVNISSIDGFKAHPDNAHYAATKAAVISLTRSLALELAPAGIVINSVAPGPMATDKAKQSDWYDEMVEALPTGKPIEPTEVADLVAFLASTSNRSIAGENVIISGAGVIA